MRALFAAAAAVCFLSAACSSEPESDHFALMSQRSAGQPPAPQPTAPKATAPEPFQQSTGLLIPVAPQSVTTTTAQAPPTTQAFVPAPPTTAPLLLEPGSLSAVSWYDLTMQSASRTEAACVDGLAPALLSEHGPTDVPTSEIESAIGSIWDCLSSETKAKIMFRTLSAALMNGAPPEELRFDPACRDRVVSAAVRRGFESTPSDMASSYHPNEEIGRALEDGTAITEVHIEPDALGLDTDIFFRCTGFGTDLITALIESAAALNRLELPSSMQCVIDLTSTGIIDADRSLDVLSLTLTATATPQAAADLSSIAAAAIKTCTPGS